MNLVCLLLVATAQLGVTTAYEWLRTEALQEVLRRFSELDKSRKGGLDVRSTAPFVSADAFREALRPRVCLTGDMCQMDHTLHTSPGDAIYVDAECLSSFVRNVAPKLEHSFVLVVHNGPQEVSSSSTGTGALSLSDAETPGTGTLVFPDALTQPLLRKMYVEGRLLAYHGHSLSWEGYERGLLRPAYMHCIPRGIDSRTSPQGDTPQKYVLALKELLMKRGHAKQVSQEKPLLLLNGALLHESSGVPHVDRTHTQLHALFASNEFGFNHTELHTVEAWLAAVAGHRFTAVPSARGRDSHRIMDVLLMGGVPVLRRNPAASCYDNSDNQANLTTIRGSLPVVIVDNWKQVTNQFLHNEWTRISAVPAKRWDVGRLWVDHWLSRAASINQVFSQDIFPPITSRLPAHMYLHNEPVRGLNGRGW